MAAPPIAYIGLSLEAFVLGLAIGFAILVGLAIAAAGVGVAIFGPRERDSLIIPAMVVFGVLATVLFTARFTSEGAFVAIAGITGFGTAALQRVAIDRISADSTAWPAIYLVGGVVTGIGVGIVAGLLVGLGSGGPGAIGAAAIVGSVVGGLIGRRAGRPIPEAGDKAASRPDDAPSSAIDHPD